MKCRGCLQDNPSHANFCLKCGAPLKGADPTAKRYTDLKDEVDGLRRSLTEALEQQTATSNILRVISRSPTDLQPVMDTVAEHAARLCEASDAQIFRLDGGAFRLAASHGPLPPARQVPVTRGSVAGRAVIDRQTVHIRDIATEPSGEFPDSLAKGSGLRTLLAVPLLREGVPIGAVVIRRMEVRPFSDKHIELLQTFADQAVIAIENVRLFTELQEKNHALTTAHAQVTEALDQQTATAEILRVISSSPTEVQPVFDTIAERAMRLCNANQGLVGTFDGERIHLRALANFDASGAEAMRRMFPILATQGSVLGRTVLTKTIVQIPAMLDDPEYRLNSLAEVAGFRSALGVPMLKDGNVVGAVAVTSPEARVFTDREIALLQTFADQAVIAIENVRLFTELQQKNAALTQAHAQVIEALEQQTATSEILRVISQSQMNVGPVFEAIVDSAVRLLRAYTGTLTRVVGEDIVLEAFTRTDAAGDTALQARFPVPLASNSSHALALRDRAPLNVADAEADPRLSDWAHGYARVRGYRSQVVVPLLRQADAIGTISVTRREPGGFETDEIALIQTFADQAVIAIENVRLFTELQEKNRAVTQAHAQVTEALERQTATSDILKVMASSPTATQPVFDTIAENAARLCAARDAQVLQVDGDVLRLVSAYGLPSMPSVRSISRGHAVGRAVIDRQTIHVRDMAQAIAEFPETTAPQHGVQSVLAVPLVRHHVAIGVIRVSRTEIRPFTEAQIALLQTFADQAVIAIENVRLFNETKDALERQTATAEVLRVLSSSPTNVQPVMQTIVDSVIRLADADDAMIGRAEGDQIRWLAAAGTQAGPLQPISRSLPSGRAILDRRTSQVNDISVYGDEFPAVAAAYRKGVRTILATPLLREGNSVGVVLVRRTTVRPFTDQQIALLKTFADQAVIALENVRLFTELQQINHDLHEALDHQTATSDILRVISAARTDVQPVFEAITASAVRLCSGDFGTVFVYDGTAVRPAAVYNASDRGVDQLRRVFGGAPTLETVTGRALLTREVVHRPDAQHASDVPGTVAMARAWPYSAIVSVPLVRGGQAIGTINVAKADASPFSGKEISLLQTFADQAVIAIENARLLTELQAKNASLTEALEQQTATSEILRVISSSPTDLQPVLDAVAENAARLCSANDAQIFRVEDGFLVPSASHGPIPPVGRRPITRGWVTGRAVVDRRTVHVHDLTAESDEEYPIGKETQRGTGHRTTLATPLLREGVALGAILIRRMEVRPFSDKQVSLLETFADQAVIAIENVRLFTELQASNRELTTALDTQTATSEILRVISRSQMDVQPVFDAILGSALRLLGGASGSMTRIVGGQLELAALTSIDDSSDAVMRATFPRSLQSRGTHAQAIRDRAPVNIAHRHTDPRVSEVSRATGRLAPYQSVIVVPLLRHDEAIGALGVSRREPGGFTDDEIALLQTFAAQAVIAIENARLLTELQARTQELSRSVEQLTALGEVGRAVSSSLDRETVLTTIVSRAVELSRLDGGVVFEYDEDAEEFVQRAQTETGSVLAEARRTNRIRKGEGVLGQTAITLESVQVSDIMLPGAYAGRLRENLIESGIRAILAVPMVYEGRLIGCLGVTRNQPGNFPNETIELLRTFATQSALAIQNARLFHEIEVKSRQLEAASQHKSEFLANMSHELRTPLNAIIGFSEVLSERMFGELNEKQDEYLKDIHASGQHLLSLINDILDLSKIEAGRMELELTDFNLPVALDNALTLVRERAGRHGIALHITVDERLGQVRGDERKIRQVVLNLLSNAIKFTPDGGRINVRAVPGDGGVEVSVSDTGVGIAPEDQEAIFEEFRQVGTAAKKVEGTGLGLALSRKFIELHGGRIWVHSQVGAGSTFTFTIPVRHGA